MNFNPNDMTTQIGVTGCGLILLVACLFLKINNGSCPKGLFFISVVIFLYGLYNIIRLKRTTNQ